MHQRAHYLTVLHCEGQRVRVAHVILQGPRMYVTIKVGRHSVLQLCIVSVVESKLGGNHVDVATRTPR